MSDPLEQWRESAKYWVKHSATIREIFAPLTQALIDNAEIVSGQTVLDVAAGAGEPSLTIAELVGPSGSVMCTDAIAEMLQAAKADAERQCLTNIHFRQCTADSLPFTKDTFDVALSRLGAMFFTDPPNAIREMLRVTKPNGRVAFAVWHKSELNPFCQLVTDVLERHVEPAPADPDAPGAFRFAESDKLSSVLREAGAQSVSERVFKFDMAARISAEQFWIMRSETSETLRAKLAKLSNEERSQIGREVLELVREFFSDDGMRFPAQILIVSGRKPD